MRFVFKKYVAVLLLILAGNQIFAQADTTLSFWFPDVTVTDKDFKSRYDSVKSRVVRVYPYALRAQELLEEYHNATADVTKKSKIKEFGKEAQKKLKEDFKYIIKEMYVSEGKILMKLIHLETGFTVREIIEMYRGKGKASWYQFIGNMFDQDLSATYDPKKDWIIEMVLRDIHANRIQISPNAKVMTKDEYQEIRKKRKERKKKLMKWRKSKEYKEQIRQKEEELKKKKEEQATKK
ncbi:MAG: DUF4294 domain-containing protein [Crocinitomicaceae bacterium]